MSFIIILMLLHGCACFCLISEWWLAVNFFARHTGYFIYIENVISDCGEKLCHIIFALRSEIYTGWGWWELTDSAGIPLEWKPDCDIPAGIETNVAGLRYMEKSH